MVQQDPSNSIRDKACAVLARAAIFPISVDWSGKHHSIRPALQALDLVRKDFVDAGNTSYSKLFPRHVIVVPSPTGGMQWNGQPDIVDSSIEAIPNNLMVTCMSCSNDEDDPSKGAPAYIRNKESAAKSTYDEIVLCTNRLLQSDYDRSADPTLLEQRRDLPPKSLAKVEQTLAHQIARLRGQRNAVESSSSPCERLAAVELYAARMAECLYRKEGKEVYRGSALRPLGFSLLPRALQENFQTRCAQLVAIEATSREYGSIEGKKCVEQASEAESLSV